MSTMFAWPDARARARATTVRRAYNIGDGWRVREYVDGSAEASNDDGRESGRKVAVSLVMTWIHAGGEV